MNVLIVGCGKVGCRLAQMLAADGHDVSVVDESEDNLRHLGTDFTGFTTCGLPIDRDTLLRAGIESCEAVACVCAEDNVNIMVGQIAKEIFGVKNVLVRIYDVEREAVYSDLGLSTFCPTNLNAAVAFDALIEKNTPKSLQFGSHMLQFYEVKAPRQVYDCDISQVELSEHHFLFAVQKAAGNLCICSGAPLKIQKGDTLIIGMNVD